MCAHSEDGAIGTEFIVALDVVVASDISNLLLIESTSRDLIEIHIDFVAFRK